MTPAARKKTSTRGRGAGGTSTRGRSAAGARARGASSRRATATRNGSQAGQFRELEEFVRKEMHRLRVPGVAVGIIHDDREYSKGFGVTSIENPSEVNEQTLFQIGSTTKTYTATAVMQLVEQGKVRLEAPLRRYMKDFRLSDDAVARKVTPWHLLTHTGGWLGDFFEDTGRGDDSLAKMMEKVAGLPQLTPLGQTWSYNNAGFYVAGRLIEVITGKTYEQVIKENIFDPLEMDRSFFFPEEVMTHRFVVGHFSSESDIRVSRNWAMGRSINPAGGITSNVADQLKYASFWLGRSSGRGKRVLKRASMKLMQSEQAPAGSIASAVGLSWLLRTVGGARVVAHGGTTPGQLSAFSMVPERDFAITVLTNSTTGGQLHGSVVQWAHEHLLGLKEPDPVPLELPDEALQVYAGKYQLTVGELRVSIEDGNLIARITYPRPQGRRGTPPPEPAPIRLQLSEEDRAFVSEGPYKGTRGEFLRNPDGTVAWLRFGGRIIRKVE